MVNDLPRNINDNHCVYVHLKKKLVYKSSYVHGLINLKNFKKWLTCLVKTPLYIYYNITIDNTFLNNNNNEAAPELVMMSVSMCRLKIISQLCREKEDEENDGEDEQEHANIVFENDPYALIAQYPDSTINASASCK